MRILAASLLGASAAGAQAGDVAGERQTGPSASAERANAAPALSAEEERKTFVLPPGLSIELVAAEPLIEAPVEAVFDERGRLWVVEMRGYMRDVDGTGEREPTGRISVLRDEDGDGRMDRADRFLEKLVLPRAVAPTRGGALVLAPPELLFCSDEDGDGAADSKVVVDTGLSGVASPEYGPNGLLPTLDNAFQCACHDVRYRFINGQWTKQRTAGGGQWGITKDDLGRIFTNGNSDFLRGDFEPSQDLARDPAVEAGPLVNAEVAADDSTFPARPTPGVNRAYRDGWLQDGRLRRADAACGPWIYRGDLLPPEYRGNVFVCEPAGNLVKRMILSKTDDLRIQARNAFADREFLTSTDERFRPVNLFEGPDGALYVVDFYRGVLQHRNFMTTYLRRQILSGKLETPLDRGRIWRIFPTGEKRPKPALPAGATPPELVRLLESQNGWTRDTAQRLLVDGTTDRASTVRALADLASGKSAPLARIHALWTLAGLGAVDVQIAGKALVDRDPDVRHEALRVAEPLLEKQESELYGLVVQQSMGTSTRLRERAFLSLSGHALYHQVVGPIARDAEDPELRRAALSGIAGHHFDFLQYLLLTLNMPDHRTWDEHRGREELVKEATAAVVREGRVQDLDRLFGTIIAPTPEKPWILLALIEGALSARPKGPRGTPGCLRLSVAPEAAIAMRKNPDLDLASKAEEVLDLVTWPGREDGPSEVAVRPLTAAESVIFDRGRVLYGEVCATCHQPSGRGEPGKAPPLRDSEWVLGDPGITARIVLGGLEGPLRIAGHDWNLSMPAWNGSDEDVAAVITYLRREWNHGADPVLAEDAHAAREASRSRSKPYSSAELEAIARSSRDSAGAAGSAGFQALFDGRSLAGWRGIGDAFWAVEDGMLRGRTRGGSQSFLATESKYGDFELEADVRTLAAGNSGIQIRSRQETGGRVVGWQVEIDPSDRAWSAGLYEEGGRGWIADLSGNEPARRAFRRGDWNHFRIECVGTRVRTWINGVPGVDVLDPSDLEGFVALQVHAGKDTDLLWKDLRIRDLGCRAWEPLFSAEDWKKARGDGGKLARPAVGDFSARFRVRGLGFRVLARATPDLKRGVDLASVAPGVRTSSNAWDVQTSKLALPAGTKPDGEHVVGVTILGSRIAVHVDGRLVADARGSGPAEGSLVLLADGESSAPFELLGAEWMSEPKRALPR